MTFFILNIENGAVQLITRYSCQELFKTFQDTLSYSLTLCLHAKITNIKLLHICNRVQVSTRLWKISNLEMCILYGNCWNSYCFRTKITEIISHNPSQYNIIFYKFVKTCKEVDMTKISVPRITLQNSIFSIA